MSDEEYTRKIDIPASVEQFELVASMNLNDLFKALDKGNLEAAQAHMEVIKMFTYISPTLGINDYPLINIKYEFEK